MLIFLIVKIKLIMPALIVLIIFGLNLTAAPQFISMFFGEEEFLVEIADTDKKKALGLMFRKEIPDNFGMLFIYPDEDYRGIWMKNTLVSLDLIYLNSSKEITEIIYNVPPCKKDPCKTYISKDVAQYVLELKGNRAKSLNLKKGDRIFFIL